MPTSTTPNGVSRRVDRDPTTRGVQAIITTGGTGISSRDRTYEAVTRLLEKTLDGFGELFRMLSYQEIGPAAMLSRACAGLARGTFIFCLPGSNGACKDGWDKVIRWQLDSRHLPCNMVELMPRLMER